MEGYKMPAECNVCRKEVSYNEKSFELKCGGHVVICKKCWRKAK